MPPQFVADPWLWLRAGFATTTLARDRCRLGTKHFGDLAGAPSCHLHAIEQVGVMRGLLCLKRHDDFSGKRQKISVRNPCGKAKEERDASSSRADKCCWAGLSTSQRPQPSQLRLFSKRHDRIRRAETPRHGYIYYKHRETRVRAGSAYEIVTGFTPRDRPCH